MKFKRDYSIEKGQLNITPLIDVIFLLFIYFMLTSTFIMQPGIRIDLPEASTTETIKEKEIFVSVSKEGMIFYKDTPVAMEELEDTLRAEIQDSGSEFVLVVKGDKEAHHGVVVTVMDISRKLGINRIAIATTPDF